MAKRNRTSPSERLSLRKRALTIWIVAADSAHGRVMQSKGPGKEWLPIRNAVFDTSPQAELPMEELGSDLPAAIQPASAISDRRRLAAEIAAFVNLGALQGKFERLVLIAPPKMLGELRKKLSPQAASKVVAELVKDVMHETAGELPEFFRRQMPGTV